MKGKVSLDKTVDLTTGMHCTTQNTQKESNSHFPSKVDTLDLNIDELCDRSENPHLENILNVWQLTNSPFWSHWRKLMNNNKFGDFVLKSIGGPKWFQFGLPTVDDEMSV